jgi:hypothetical protein
MKETLKDKFNTLKTNVKETWDKSSDADKTKFKKDIKDRNYSGVADTVKQNFNKGSGKV